MRNLLLTIAAAVTALFASAGAPNGYYNGISGLKDAALKNKLYEIVSKQAFDKQLQRTVQRIVLLYRRASRRNVVGHVFQHKALREKRMERNEP